MERVLITGSTGLIGSYLKSYLNSNDFEILTLSRDKNKTGDNSYYWDIKNKYIQEGALENSDFIVHLAGAGIADKRWTKDRKKEIINSRVDSTNLIFEKIKEIGVRPKAFISASAIGYYGAVTSEKIFEENDKPGNDFQAKVCKIWEDTSKNFSDEGIRTVQLRFGVVLSAKGGALKKMLFPTKLGMGSPLGSGRQYFPWVHIKDVSNAILTCLENENLSGPYNIVAPQEARYEDFSNILAKILNRPHFAPNVPSILLKIIFGEMAKIILEGSRISSTKIISAGFKFDFDNLEDALKNLLEK